MKYADRLKKILTPLEHKIFKKLSSSQKIQDYLDTLPINFEIKGETYMSARRVIREKTAHCFEGALLAAAALAYHGERPLLMDFQTVPADEDHVVTLFREGDLWGAFSKTNHALLRYRDPIYKSPRELAMSYFHEYFEWNGKKSLRNYSKPFDLSRFAPERWITAEEELDWLVEALDVSLHFAAVPKKSIFRLRKVAPVELKHLRLVEWKDPRGSSKG